MADLRESGAIEQDSDNILFIHEPNIEEINKLISEGIFTANFFNLLEIDKRKYSQLIIEKQRNGQTCTISVIKAPQVMKFIEVEGKRC